VALKPNFLRKERLRRYRRYLYEAGAVNRAEIGQRRVTEEKVVGKERKKEFNISRGDRFRYGLYHIRFVKNGAGTRSNGVKLLD